MTDQAKDWRKFIPGELACIALAAASIAFAETEWAKNTLHVSALLVVILVGMALRTFLRLPDSLTPGTNLAKADILRWAVAGLGFKLSLAKLAEIGGPALVLVIITTFASLAFGYWVCRVLGVDKRFAALIGVGGSICGASAIVAADSVLATKKGDSACALASITLLGTIGIIVFPWLGHMMGLSSFAYGVWNGASLHEMAQVVAAGHGFGADAVDPSSVTKLARIALLAPIVIGLAAYLQSRNQSASKAKVAAVPWFLIMFVVFALVNSLGVIPKETVELIVKADLWLLCIGMAGVGLQSGLKDLLAAGWRPILASTIQWIVLSLMALGLVKLFIGFGWIR